MDKSTKIVGSKVQPTSLYKLSKYETPSPSLENPEYDFYLDLRDAISKYVFRAEWEYEEPYIKLACAFFILCYYHGDEYCGLEILVCR